MKTTYYNQGDIVVLRQTWKGKVLWAQPLRVVEDTPDMIALYMAEGTLWKEPRNTRGERVACVYLRKEEKWFLMDVTWRGLGRLSLTIPGSMFSVYIFWNSHYRDIKCWYINLEDPLHHTPTGFEHTDMELDAVLSGDLSEWHWKDEANFRAVESYGLISQEKALKLRAEGERVVKMLQSGTSPFNRWRTWVPPQNWQGISMPSGWDKT